MEVEEAPVGLGASHLRQNIVQNKDGEQQFDFRQGKIPVGGVGADLINRDNGKSFENQGQQQKTQDPVGMTPVFFGEQVGQPQQEALQHGSPNEGVDYFFHGQNDRRVLKDNLLVEKTQAGKKSIWVGKDYPDRAF